MTEKRFTIDVLDENNWLIQDTKTGENANPIDGTTNVLKGLISTLNKFNDENEQLKQRNINQYNQLNELWQIIEEENWEKLIAMKKQLKEDEERLQQEWKCYE